MSPSPTSTTGATTTLAPEPTYTISADLPLEPFSDDLTNRNSSRFKDLEQRVVGACNSIYRTTFGAQFDRCFVKQFRPASPGLTRVNGTEAEMGVVFNRTTPTTDLPQNTVVAQTLVEAVNSSTNMFNLTINPNTVEVLTSPVVNATTTANLTTAAPTTANLTTAAPTTSNPSTAAPITSNPSTAAPTTSNPSTAAPTTSNPSTAAPTTSKPSTAAPTTAALTTRRVTFRSLLTTFTSDLLDTSSAAFTNRASMIKGQLEPLYQREFPSSFNSLDVVAFRNGSIINDMNLTFESTSVPNNTQIASVLINAASTVTGFDIEGSSITVDGISSSGVSHKISLVTASCLVLLSWLLSNQQ
ncbi:salivary glue protein Sgs-3-like [Seriola lalandi dorsalis]|uniref:salivary glue protein Sgs-3-like n=1 Tax=Seriola lalandi dorsalis TaxID=1841481 RepID=UPI000C6F8AD6|nr:salivary glue protein Sgs-3-like [Seriola lalandi dorsalis]